jgi:hypothetical protein
VTDTNAKISRLPSSNFEKINHMFFGEVSKEINPLEIRRQIVIKTKLYEFSANY